MVHNVVNSNTPNDKDIRPQLLVAQLEKLVAEYDANNWNVLEIATLSMKVMEQLILHCKQNKIPFPKKLICMIADDSGEIEFKFNSAVKKRFVLPN